MGNAYQNLFLLYKKNPELKIEIVTTQLEFPTSMTFMGPDDILVLEKNKGTVKRIVNGSLLPKPLLDVNVGTLNDRGMLGYSSIKELTIFLFILQKPPLKTAQTLSEIL